MAESIIVRDVLKSVLPAIERLFADCDDANSLAKLFSQYFDWHVGYWNQYFFGNCLDGLFQL